MPNLTVFQATMLAERAYDKSGIDPGEIDTDLIQQAWLLLVDTEVVWTLQGSFGRTARHLIKAGVIQPNRHAIH